MSLIDTSVLLYAAHEDCREHDAAINLLKKFVDGTDPWHLTWQNIFEFVRSVTHPRGSRKVPLYIDEAMNVVRKLLATQSLQLIHPGPRHFDIFADLTGRTPGIRGNGVLDARLAAIMIENGVRRIYTADEGFTRFRDIDVVNPFRT